MRHFPRRRRSQKQRSACSVGKNLVSPTKNPLACSDKGIVHRTRFIVFPPPFSRRFLERQRGRYPGLGETPPHSCGTAPDSHRTSPFQPGLSAQVTSTGQYSVFQVIVYHESAILARGVEACQSAQRCFGSRLFANQAKDHEKHETLSRLSPPAVSTSEFASFVVQTIHHPNLLLHQPIQLIHQRANLPVRGLDWVLESCLFLRTFPPFPHASGEQIAVRGFERTDRRASG